MPDLNKPKPTRPAPPLAEVRRLLDRYRRAETRVGGYPIRRAERPPVLNPPDRKRGD